MTTTTTTCIMESRDCYNDCRCAFCFCFLSSKSTQVTHNFSHRAHNRSSLQEIIIVAYQPRRATTATVKNPYSLLILLLCLYWLSRRKRLQRTFRKEVYWLYVDDMEKPLSILIPHWIACTLLLQFLISEFSSITFCPKRTQEFLFWRVFHYYI